MKKVGTVVGFVALILIGASIYVLYFRDDKSGGGTARDPNSTSMDVSREMYGRAWPMKVESGRLECLPGRAVVFHTDGRTYAVNDIAVSRELGENIRPIWRDNTNMPGTKVFLILVDEGLKLCKSP